jgi:hypothetical protein
VVGALWLPIFLEGFTSPSGEAEVCRGFERFDDVVGAQARPKLPPKAPISPKTSLQGSGGMEVDFHVLSD